MLSLYDNFYDNFYDNVHSKTVSMETYSKAVHFVVPSPTICSVSLSTTEQYPNGFEGPRQRSFIDMIAKLMMTKMLRLSFGSTS
jgi:hypothetical protein